MERIVSKRGDVIASEFPDGQAEIAAIRKTLGFCIGQRSNAHREVVIERADDRERNRFSIRHPNGAVMLRVLERGTPRKLTARELSFTAEASCTPSTKIPTLFAGIPRTEMDSASTLPSG